MSMLPPTLYVDDTGKGYAPNSPAYMDAVKSGVKLYGMYSQQTLERILEDMRRVLADMQQLKTHALGVVHAGPGVWGILEDLRQNGPPILSMWQVHLGGEWQPVSVLPGGHININGSLQYRRIEGDPRGLPEGSDSE